MITLRSIRRSFPSFALVVALALGLGACATTNIKASKTMNPPPTGALKTFQRFELKPIAMGAPYAGQEANDKALKKIQENMDIRLGKAVTAWNAKAPAAASDRTLVIEPAIKDIKFINGTARVWAGAMAGSSAVVITVRCTDKATGAVVAEPEFYQRAAAMGGAWTMGATDNNMLVRITEITDTYFLANYDRAVGGATGAPVEK